MIIASCSMGGVSNIGVDIAAVEELDGIVDSS